MYGLLKRLGLDFRPRGAAARYESGAIALDGGAGYVLVYDAATDDPVVRGYLAGERPNGFQLDLLRRFTKPGDCVLDLGAHVGTFALAAAASGCRVIAVDAAPNHVEQLRRSAARNRFRKMRVVHAAVGERSGSVGFHVAGLWGMVAQPGRDPIQVGPTPTTMVPAVTGDQLLRRLRCRRVDFLKMDIEGSELAAVRSFKGLLSRDDAPVIAYECNGLTLPHYGHSTADLLAALEGFGYRTYRVEPGGFRLYRADEFQPELYLDVVAFKPRWEHALGAEAGPPLGTSELVERAWREARMGHENHRAHVARELARAGRAVLDNPRIQAALEALGRDPHPSVRDAAGWWTTARVA